jgi:hypothetical protein
VSKPLSSSTPTPLLQHELIGEVRFGACATFSLGEEGLRDRAPHVFLRTPA